MASLNNQLQMTLLNRKKGRNLVEKGFTLVELLIVVVILGVLSAVALPNFINQSDKAKLSAANTEAKAAATACASDLVVNGTAASCADGDTFTSSVGIGTEAVWTVSGTAVTQTTAPAIGSE